MSGTDTLRVRLVGVAPMLMRNGDMADPLNPFTRELSRYTARRKKTEADLERIADLEFVGGLWLHEGRPCIRGDAIEGAICQSAARRRAKGVYRSAVVVRGHPRLNYAGPTDPDLLRADPRFRHRVGVSVNGKRLFRTRPIFEGWSAEVEIDVLTSLVTRDELMDVLVVAGDTVGVGDNRPKYGRFKVVAP